MAKAGLHGEPLLCYFFLILSFQILTFYEGIRLRGGKKHEDF